MGTDNVIFLEIIEWFDQTGQQMVNRIPEHGSGEIKLGAQLIVRDSQGAVFFYNGKACDVFGPGRHTLITANVPILNKILSIPWGAKSPLRAEVYFTNMKVFTNLKWGTKDPVAFKDSELGLIRLRAFGIFDVQVLQPALFINNLVGTKGVFSTDDIEEYISRIIVSRFNDHLGAHLDSVLNLPGRYDELADGLEKIIELDLSHYGLGLRNLYINSITPPPEVQQAIDDKSRLAVFDDLNKLLKMKAAMALEKAAGAEGGAAQGMGMGMGMMMPSMFAQHIAGGGATGSVTDASKDDPSPPKVGEINCPECSGTVGKLDRFCPSCGHQLVVFQQCENCRKNLPPHAAFCSRCGAKVEHKESTKNCSKCNAENLRESVFCNQCGERL